MKVISYLILIVTGLLVGLFFFKYDLLDIDYKIPIIDLANLFLTLILALVINEALYKRQTKSEFIKNYFCRKIEAFSEKIFEIDALLEKLQEDGGARKCNIEGVLILSAFKSASSTLHTIEKHYSLGNYKKSIQHIQSIKVKLREAKGIITGGQFPKVCHFRQCSKEGHAALEVLLDEIFVLSVKLHDEAI